MMARFERAIRRPAAILLAFIAMAITMPGSVLAKTKHKSGRHHKRRHHTHFTRAATEHNRKLAIEFLRQNSPRLSQLADLPPITPSEADPSVLSAILSQSESAEDTTDATGDAIADGAIQEPEDTTELEAYDDVKVDINEFRRVWLAYVEHSGDSSTPRSPHDAIDKQRLMRTVVHWLGTPYWYGGTTARGIDCSGFTRMVFDSAAAMMLPRSARDQYLLGAPVDRDELRFGDLVFFHTRRRPFVSHVGIYLGDNLFTHSSSRYGVTISSLESTYYAKHFIEGRRVVPDATTAAVQNDQVIQH